jgi:hypothetical protein
MDRHQSRRTLQISVQRLLTVAARSEGPAAPPLLPSDLAATVARAPEAPPSAAALTLPPFLRTVCSSSQASPACACCLRPMAWCEWRRDATALPLGQGLFSARCAACRDDDATPSFKDGVVRTSA